MRAISTICSIAITCFCFSFSSVALAEKDPAKDACVDKEESDACEYNDPNGNNINGTCQYQGDTKDKLVCAAYK